jgi:hypothetical protein
MKIRSLIIAVGFALASGSAFASSCPKHMKAIDAALPNAKITSAQMADVKKYRAEGEALHKAGKHAESMEALSKAEKISASNKDPIFVRQRTARVADFLHSGRPFCALADLRPGMPTHLQILSPRSHGC